MSNEAMRRIKKKSHLWGDAKWFSLCMWSIFFTYNCSVLLPRLSSTSVAGFQCCFLICCDVPGTFPSVLIQTDAWWKVFLLKVSRKEFPGEYIFLQEKQPWPLITAWKLKPHLLRAHTCYQTTPKHSSEASIYSEAENLMFPCRCVKPVLSSTHSLKSQTGDDAFHRILCRKWE